VNVMSQTDVHADGTRPETSLGVESQVRLKVEALSHTHTHTQ